MNYLVECNNHRDAGASYCITCLMKVEDERDEALERVSELEKERESNLARIAELEKTLAFYADPQTYSDRDPRYYGAKFSRPIEYDVDKKEHGGAIWWAGARARKALHKRLERSKEEWLARARLEGNSEVGAGSAEHSLKEIWDQATSEVSLWPEGKQSADTFGSEQRSTWTCGSRDPDTERPCERAPDHEGDHGFAAGNGMVVWPNVVRTSNETSEQVRISKEDLATEQMIEASGRYRYQDPEEAKADITVGEVRILREEATRWLNWAANNQELHEQASRAAERRGFLEGCIQGRLEATAEFTKGKSK